MRSTYNNPLHVAGTQGLPTMLLGHNNILVANFAPFSSGVVKYISQGYETFISVSRSIISSFSRRYSHAD